MKQRKPNAKRDGPPKHEWLFVDRKLLPDEETEGAYFWEFGLESPDVIAEVEATRRKTVLSEQVDRQAMREWHLANPRPEDSEKWREWTNRFSERFPDYFVTMKSWIYEVHFLSDWPEFPDLHWLEIPPDVRQDKKRIRPVSGECDWRGDMWEPHFWLKQEEGQKFDAVPSFFYKTGLGLACHTWLAPYLPPSLDLWKDWTKTSKTPWGFASADRWHEYRLMEVAWARSDRKLKADFAEWLKENRPDDRQPYHKLKESNSRRTTHRDLLKALGALRLLRHFKGVWGAAADYSALFCTDKRGGQKPLYVEQSEWRDAEKRAIEALTQFSKKVFG